MNTSTGELKEMEDVQHDPNWVPVRRKLSDREKMDKQIRIYSRCGCGSGQKFKFCCHKKQVQSS